MPKIFISYRRSDSQYVTDTIYEHMVQHFGVENVFLDVGSIPIGVDFRTYLHEQIAAHDTLLVIIGPEWARLMQERADQPNDFVRIEIENALQLDKLVIPVLVKGAEMPDFSPLPASIAELGWRNSAVVRRQPDLGNDCRRLAEGIQAFFEESSQESPAMPTAYDVTLIDSGTKIIQVIKVIRQLTGLGLKEAKDLAQETPSTIFEGVELEAAEYAKQELEAFDASVEIVGIDQ